MTVTSENRTGGDVDPDVEGADADEGDADPDVPDSDADVPDSDVDAAAGTDRGDDEPTVRCPFCESTDVEQESQFGSEISKSQYYCNGCHTVFERIKYDGKRPDTS
ncbi:PaaD-like zinc ribbon domain-containing protein [Halopenitus persicus]|uniref:PaaD zinc beta ribbon domain-containing protein n=1 Tax=Halopenitus persicus TaxID=1048396 RepID=A0A1H3EW01_9EURY|nr:hypothetical protein [Halopenitus persicus]SDX82805.1 hypothetical protein SAMN05216564_101618 [Halopenitus persicus]